MTNLTENIFQKLAWFMYVVVAAIVFFLVDTYNTNSPSCTHRGNCLSMASYIGALTLVFITIALLLKSKKKK